MKQWLLLPALNEAEALRRLVPETAAVLKTLGRPFEILVVNDGSTDDTSSVLAAMAETIPVRELKHPVNQGYGAALRTGYEYLLAHAAPEDIVISMDCDNTHPPRFISALIQAIERGAEIVTASYTLPGGAVFGVPPRRRFTSAVCNGLFRLVFPYPAIYTYTNGFRAYRLVALRNTVQRFGPPLIQETGFPGGVELFLKTLAAGATASEVPFDLHYENRGGASKIRVWSTILGYLRLLVRLRLHLEPGNGV